MFNQLTPAPPDAILGLTEAFLADPTSDKINLGVGVYKDEQGLTPTLTSVQKAEERLLAEAASKSYLPISGSPGYAAGVQSLLFGEGHSVLSAGRVRTAQTPGGTGGLRVGGDFLKDSLPDAKVWVSSPTWANHKGVFAASGFELADYPYYDPQAKGLDFEAMAEALRQVPAGDVVLLHVCCHNPTGVDPSADQWATVAEIAAEAGWMPFFDFAYQGFGRSLEEDRKPLALFADKGIDYVVAASCSKNFGLYNERTGSFSLVAKDADAADIAFSRVKTRIRTNYSNPPRHGGAIVECILGDDALRSEWENELAGMRTRIHSLREQFVAGLAAQGVEQDFGFIARQMGMFSFSGLNPEQVKTLREEHHIYMVGSGRINVAGMSSSNLERLCAAVAGVL